MARPRKHLDRQHVSRLKELVDRRATHTEIAREFGIDRATWLRIRREDERVAEILKAGKEAEERELVGSLYQQAVGRPAEYDAEGNVVRAEQKPSAVAAMFLLKARFGYRDQGPVDGSEAGPRITINLPSPLTPDQWRNMVDVTPGRIEGQSDG